MNQKIDFEKISLVHLIGIKGIGMTALAACLKDLGIKITGSDVAQEFITDQTLKKMKLSWWENFSSQHIKNQELVIATGSGHQGLNNPEALAAKKKGIPYLTHGQALGELMKKKVGISICGVGGKTTTSAIVATLMKEVNLKPSFAIGAAEIFPLGLPGHFEKQGKFFVAEADEYATAKNFDHRPRFDWQNPQIVVCTNIEHDHPDIYPNLDSTKKVFKNFFEKIPNDGVLIINGDNENNQKVIKNLNKKILTYGEGDNNNYRIKEISLSQGKTSFSLQYNEQKMGVFALNVPGRHNIFNAAAAIIVLRHLGVDLEKIKKALPKFAGTKRRFEFLGKRDKKEIWDDYAHHPKQIRATLSAAKKWFGEKPITVLFQSHTLTRTQQLIDDFAKSFDLADQVFILPIYDAGRESGDTKKIAQRLTQKIKKKQKRVFFVPNEKIAIEKIKKIDQGIILTMGAGDVWKIGLNFLKND
ncbi:MAG: UDP-N-acetylmuramate/alanine ligase [Microgenomates bacterium 39_6]|nr:MAG: UDP-N-acetylmuramate/alanine ligase [Microgenomates bacterium 39_6]